MNLSSFLLTGGNGIASMAGWVLYFGVIIGAFYFIAIRPQKKNQKQHAALLSTLETGDSVLTSSGFYGVVIDVMEEVVIVEFGNNKNCRIPMKREAITEIEKANKEE